MPLPAPIVRAFLTLVCTAAVRGVDAQTAMVSGTVVGDGGAPVAAARVSIAGTLISTSTDGTGVFRLGGVQGEITLEVHRIGFAAVRHRMTIVAGRDPDPVVIRMTPIAAALTGVLIPGERSVALGQTVNRATVRNAPPLGEPDVMRVLPFVPGVNMPNEFVPRVNLAGAAADETSITLDGHPLQFPTHLAGIVGAFNVAALDRAELLMHHVPATLDTRLGGTLALHTREPSTRGDGEFVLSLLAASTTVGTPLPSIGGDLLVSGRYTYLAHTIERVYGSLDPSGFAWPYYGDLLARFGNRVGERWRHETIGYFAHDWIDVTGHPGAVGYSIGEAMAGTRLIREGPSSRLTIRLSQDLALATDGWTSGSMARDARIEQRMTSVGLSRDAQHSDGVASTIALTFDERRHTARWPYRFSDSRARELPLALNVNGDQRLVAIAGETRWRRGTDRQTAFGLRLSTAGTGAYLAPRFRTSWQPTPSLRVEAAYDRRYQFDAQVGDARYGTFPPPTFLLRRPRRMDGVATTLEWEAPLTRGRSLALSLTPFARSYVARTAPVARTPDTTAVTRIDFTRIAARGLGVGVGLSYARANGASFQVAYTATSVRERDDGVWVRSNWATPHSTSAILTVPFLRTWEFTAAAQFQSGAPLTPINGQLLVPSELDPNSSYARPVYGERNSTQLPMLRRMDVALRRSWNVRGAQLTLSVQGVNVLFRENALEYDLRDYLDGIESGYPQSPRREGFPFIPSFGLGVRW